MVVEQRRGDTAAALVFAAVALAGVWFGGFALWQRLVLGVRRAHLPDVMNAIVFGDLALLVAVVSAAGLFWVAQAVMRARAIRTTRWLLMVFLLLLLVLGVAGGLLATVYSATRGAWIVLPPALLVLYLLQWRRLPVAIQCALFASLAAVVVVVYLTPATGVAARIAPLHAAWLGLLDGDPFRVFWYRPTLYLVVARDLIPEHWLFGHGWSGLQADLQRLRAESDNPALARIAVSPNAWHAHNDLLQLGYSRGVLGVAALLAAYALPVVIALRFRRRPEPAVQALVCALLLLAVCFIGFGLTYSLFAYWLPVAVYALMVLLLSLPLFVSSAARDVPGEYAVADRS